jgi:hypothetical protein
MPLMFGFGRERDVVMRRERYGNRTQNACAHGPAARLPPSYMYFPSLDSPVSV